MNDNKKKISIVIPCYNEEAVLPELFERITKAASQWKNYRYEVICIDDGSIDRTWNLLQEQHARDSRWNALSFSRNFGHQIAITAGIEVAKGDAVVLIDADLQDPPEVIHQMITKWDQGYDVVYGTRTERHGETSFKKGTAKLFYRLLNYLSDVTIPMDTGDFRLMSRKVVDTLRLMPERDRFMRGMVSWVGFKQIALPYKRNKRVAGESKYPLKKMLRFATDGILSFSTKPLKISIVMGIFCALLAMLGILYALFLRLFTDIWVEGWTALMIAVLFIGGVQLITVGILGEYIGRIFNETKNRPLYVVQEHLDTSKEGTSLLRSSDGHYDC